MKWAKNICVFPLVPVTASQHTGGKGCHSKGPDQMEEVDLCEPREIQQGQVQCPGRGWGQFHSTNMG